MKFKVYVDYTVEESPRPFYVGKGSAGRVKCLFGRNQLHESIARKYGINRVVEFETDDEQESFRKERELISLYRTFMNHEPGQWGSNFTEGGDGASGWIPSAETRKKIGAASRLHRDSEETRKKKGEAAVRIHTGRKRSEETRQKLSESRKGKSPWNKGKKLGPREVPRVFSEEARRNISNGCKGRVPWNKGLRNKSADDELTT